MPTLDSPAYYFMIDWPAEFVLSGGPLSEGALNSIGDILATEVGGPLTQIIKSEPVVVTITAPEPE